VKLLGFFIIALTALLFTANTVAVIFENKTNCNKFVRSIKLFVYDITPALYITFSILLFIIGAIFSISIVYTLIAVALLLLSCTVAYLGRFMSLCRKKKKAVKRSPLKPLRLNECKELPKLVLVKKSKPVKPMKPLRPAKQ